ncbi:MAG: WecB/TagA/CpsF family glycosyltransferase [Acidobacteriota bacterium]
MSREPSVEIAGPLGRPPRTRRAATLRALAALAPLVAEAATRSVDVIVSALVLLLCSPFLALVGLSARLRGRSALRRERVLGRFQKPFHLLGFSGAGPLCGLPMFWNVLVGDMALVGPRPLALEERDAVPVAAMERFSVRPGLTSTYRLGAGVGIYSGEEFESDREYYYEESLKSDLGVLARSVANRALSGSSTAGTAVGRFQIFGVEIANLSMEEAVDWIVERARASRTSKLAFVNPDCLNLAYRNPEYRGALRDCDLVLPDGIGVHLACRMLGTRLLANTNGTDLFPLLCERAALETVPLYFLGAREGIAQGAAEAMQKRYPGLPIVGTQHGYFPEAEEAAVVDAVADAEPRVVLVAFGAPRQDTWIADRIDRLPAGVAMGVGGLFDYYSGRIERAPRWVREVGMEWAWRVLQEPGRLWRRYLVGNPLFLWRVWMQTLGRGPGACNV